MTQQAGKPFLYVVVCAAGIAADVGELIGAAQRRGWEVGIIATPVAMNGFFDTAAVETRTGRPVRSAWRTPGDPRPFPPPDAVVVAPATFNTVNKWAAGLADTLAVATLCEASGLGVPVAAL
ncbi:flavoprotein, partial [Streptomyces pharetrae]|uniref:flavoprotein n=1 Tax=Streptomyces pharetrae TaxID=291370 RepID=UPI0033633CE7